MFRLTIAFIVLTATWFQQNASAQSLTEQLSAEVPDKLVQLAQKNGDIIRGAILFHQGNINCAKCHRATAENEHIGPDLSRLGDDVTDVSIVESILEPSRIIKKGYETVTILTLDGTLIDGMIDSEDNQTVVIRDRQFVDNLITVARENIDTIKPGQFSSMPEKLADELKNRQQFLDLLRYVIDIKGRGPQAVNQAAKAPSRRQLGPILEGLVAIQKYGCVSCHTDNSNLPGFVRSPRAVPNLKWSAKFLNPEFVRAFIANPHTAKPRTTMPDLFGELGNALRDKSALAITSYLVTKAQNKFRFQPIDKEAVTRGFSDFHSVGCVACHSPRGRNGIENPLPDSTPLGHVTRKYNIDALANFLEHPLNVRASGHMPNMQLSHREATDIANYLLQDSPASTTEFNLNTELVEQGELLFEQMNCTSCHSSFRVDNEQGLKQLPIRKVDPLKGCLSGKMGIWPSFKFDRGELENIQAAIRQSPSSMTDHQQIDFTLRSLNCIACHDRNELGGIDIERNPHFTTTNLNLGDQGRIPPTLTGVGAKLKPKWMRDVFVNRRSIRPYMNTRMPQYGEKNVGHLIDLFQKSDRLAGANDVAFEDQKETREWGLELAGNKGLNCVACHTYKYKLADTMPAVDLTEMAERLKKDWFHQYMIDPQKFSPNTVMPSFWPAGKAIRAEVKGTPEDQVEAIWQYLLDGRQARTPRGVVREPLEIVVTNEAKILRRKYPDIGKRGIGVGYPSAVNLAYDAEQMRLAMIWSGKFVDPAGVWTGQGSGQVRPLGQTIFFAKGPDLDWHENAWVIGNLRPPNHQFKGYRLDNVQRPIFIYKFNDTNVEDYFSEANSKTGEAAGLKRTVTVYSSNDESLMRLRLATGEIKNIENGYLVNDCLRIAIKTESQVEILKQDETTSVLQLRFELKQNQKHEFFIEYTWKF